MSLASTPLPAPVSPLLLRAEEVAARLGISRSHAYLLMKSNVLPCIRVGHAVRCPVTALERWIDANTAASNA